MNAPNQQIAPSNPEAEQSVLGALIMDPTALPLVVARLKPEMFFRPSHNKIYMAILDLFRRGEVVDSVTVGSELERSGKLEEIGGRAYLTELVERVPITQYVENYAALVERAAVQRKLIEAANHIAQIAWEDAADSIDETIDRAESAIFHALGDRQRSDLRSLRQILDDYFEKIEEIQATRALTDEISNLLEG